MVDDTYAIRCPFCLAGKEVSKNIDVAELLNCLSCHRRFEFQNALPGNVTQSTRNSEVVADLEVHPGLDLDQHEFRLARIKLWGFVLMLLMLWIFSVYAQLLYGPGFLLLYLGLGFISLVAANLIRWTYLDSYWVSGIAAGFLVLLGLIRYYNKVETMDNWLGMWVIMVFGFFTYFIRTVDTGSGSKTTFFGSCGGCGGGGGGCGGGCGGCG